MRPKKPETTRSGDLFRARLDQIINLKHELAQLAGKIDWNFIDGEIAPLYSDKGRFYPDTVCDRPFVAQAHLLDELNLHAENVAEGSHWRPMILRRQVQRSVAALALVRVRRRPAAAVRTSRSGGRPRHAQCRVRGQIIDRDHLRRHTIEKLLGEGAFTLLTGRKYHLGQFYIAIFQPVTPAPAPASERSEGASSASEHRP